MSLGRHARSGCAALLALASGCIDGIVVDERRGAVTLPDADVVSEEDGAAPNTESDAQADAGTPGAPALDAAISPQPATDAGFDAGRDAGFDAGRDAGVPVPAQDAGGTPDAGCQGSGCDAGALPGPCFRCGVATLTLPLCENGAGQVCWMNPDGECSWQCPETGSCTKDNPALCGPDRYCYFAANDCGERAPGFCATIPPECPGVMAEVCGCDGRTYENACVAAQARTHVALGDAGPCN